MTFPLLYHTHYGDHLEDLPFWLGLADQQGDPILELGCGTGRVLIPLIKAGHLTIGIDKDIAMLSLLKENLASECGTEYAKLSPTLVSDLCCFHLNVRFSLILVPCNTWSTLDAPTRKRSLQQIYAHLSPKGLFVASVPNPKMLSDLPASSDAEIEEIFEHPLSRNPVQVSSSWKRDKAHFNVTWYYDHLLPDGATERLRIETAHTLSSEEDYQQELETAGLHVTATWGDFDSSAYTSDSEYLILAASKA